MSKSVVELPQKHVVGRRAAIAPHCSDRQPSARQQVTRRGGTDRLTPLSLDPQKDPDPPPENLQALDGKHTTLQVVKVVQMRAQLETPRHPEQQVQRDGDIVHIGGVEVAVAAQAVGLGRVVGVGDGGRDAVEEAQAGGGGGGRV